MTFMALQQSCSQLTS